MPLTADHVKATYAAHLDDFVWIRRYTGSGPNRPMFQVMARAKVTGPNAQNFPDAAMYGERTAIVYADDLIKGGLALPLTTDDLCVVRGDEVAIIAVDSDKRKVGQTLIAYELKLRGGPPGRP